MRSLTIISHTEHYVLPDGTVVGLGSTVTEINALLAVFDTITHVAMLHHEVAPPSALPYVSDKVRFVGLPAVGGKTLSEKLTIVFQAPKIIGIVRGALKGSDYFQFRAPTGMGVFIIPYLILFSSKKGWFKYAGNWKQTDAPLAYRFQKWLLKTQSRPVTINGFCEDQPAHCLSFENPCLTEEEIRAGQLTIASKTLQFPVELCFVGRLEAAKGVDLILDALEGLDEVSLNKIRAIHFVGAGSRRLAYQNRVEASALPVRFYGFLSRTGVHDIYKKSHAILLPSASEGFPKVVAEAMNYGCIPIVSDVSSISHYIKHGHNGFLIDTLNAAGVSKILREFLTLSEDDYVILKQINSAELNTFSYTYYNHRIQNEIL